MSMMTSLLSSKFIADAVTKPGQSPVFGSPKDFELDYEDVEFKASDGVTLSGWLVKGETDKVIIQTHFGIQASRSGYTPKGLVKPWPTDIEFLRHVKPLVDAGYTVLMYDLRNHGKSNHGTVPWVTGGVEEYKDVLAAVNFISTHKTYKNAKIGLLSICMGANSTTYAYGIKNGLQDNDRIKAIIAIQPAVYDDFLHAFGFSEKQVEKANKLNLERGGKDFHSSPMNHVKNITVPTMLVQNKNDPWANLDWIKKYFDNLNVEKEMLWLDGEKKRFAAYVYFGDHPEKMLEWFNKYL